MYRLIIVSGPNRGSSFSLVEGENSIGRQMDNHLVLSSSRVSKRHCSVLVTANEVFFRDEGSTNGTFVNGAVAKKQALKPGDKIGVGDFVLELARIAVPMQQGSVSQMSLGHSVSGNLALSQQPGLSTQSYGSPAAHLSIVQNPQNHYSPPEEVEVQAPQDLPGKIQFLFETKVMPSFYGMLMKTEYRSLAAILIGFIVALGVVGSVMPMQDLAEQSIKKEAGIRAKVLSREIADRFLPMIAGHTESQIDLSIFEGEESVKFVAITNPNLQIIAPQTRLNQLLASGKEASFAIRMAKEFQEGREKGAGGLLDETTAIWIEPIKTTDARQIKSQVSAMVIVAIDFSGNMIASGGLGVTYGIAFVIAGIVGALAYFILMRLTMKPFEVLNDDLDQVLRGEIPKVTHEFKMTELDALWTNINVAVQRMSKIGQGESPSGEVVVNWDYEFSAVRAMAEASQLGFVAFDANLTTVAMNPQFEEVSGIHAESIGQNLTQMARDQSFVLLVNDLKDRVESSPSRSALDKTEFSGVDYQVIATGAGPSTSPGFALVFKKRE